MSDADWHAGPLIPAGYTAHRLASHRERVFLVCLTQVPGSDFPERKTTVFVAASKALLE